MTNKKYALFKDGEMIGMPVENIIQVWMATLHLGIPLSGIVNCDQFNVAFSKPCYEIREIEQ